MKNGLLMRGIGDYWLDSSTFSFRRHLTDTPIVISFSDVIDIKTGKWHSGRWAGSALVIKIIWKKENARLSSGFVFFRNDEKTKEFVEKLKSLCSL